MKATAEDQARLEKEALRLAKQLEDLGSIEIILFGSLARGRISLFSDIDLLAIFDQNRPARELTRWVYQNIQAREAADILAYSKEEFEKIQGRAFLQRILKDGKVIFERAPA